MATKRNRLTSGTLSLRIESNKFILADTIASHIRNMVPTEEGTLRGVRGPCPYVPYNPGFEASYTPSTIRPIFPMEDISDSRGIFHAILPKYNRDILLLESNNTIYEFQGWMHGWRPLVGQNPFSLLVVKAWWTPGDDSPRFPTQFEITDTGIIIVPQGGRAYFYDGKCIGPLGYTEVPGPPTGHGPASTEDYVTFARLERGAYDSTATPAYTPDRYIYGEEIPLEDSLGNPIQTGLADPLLNNDSYAHDAQRGFKTGMHRHFGNGRVGTVEANPGDVGVNGIVLDCRYQAAVQWIDRWGNLSPVGGRSNEVYITEQPSFIYGETKDSTEEDITTEVSPGKVDLVLKQIAWSGIEPGPEGTIGRVLCRTKDLDHSGTSSLFTMRAYAAEGGANFATIPDNDTPFFPDNVPDSWLFIPVKEPVAVPQFKLSRAAFGRNFIANMVAEEGLVRWSMPSRWGTFLKDDYLFPDPTGAEITGLWRCAQGLLVFTSGSTYLFTPNDSGDGFKSQTVSATVGCAAPSSLATTETGLTVWLSYSGFYTFSPNGISPISAPIERTLKTLNRSRLRQAVAAIDGETGEYRCWVTRYSAKENNLCFVYDGEGWRERDDVVATGVCVTRDHRQYMLVAGRQVRNGAFYQPPLVSGSGLYNPSPASPPDYNVWVLDHENQAYKPIRSPALVETAWLTGLAGKERATALTVYFWLRETKKDTASYPPLETEGALVVEVCRDWRETVIETVTTDLVPDDDLPPFYDDTLLGSGAIWVRRRPYWVRAFIYVPSCEVFKLRIHNTGDWEFLGLVFDEQPKRSGGARIPVSSG